MTGNEANIEGGQRGSASERDEVLRTRHAAQASSAIGTAFERLRWSADALKREREARLQLLIAHALSRSPWHASRLAGIDPSQVTEDTLRSLPTMCKNDVMSNFDSIVTEPRITLALANDHLRALGQGSSYLLDEFHVVATSGTSGQRGVFVYDWQGWLECYATVHRYALAYAAAGGLSPAAATAGFVIAHVAASHVTHMTFAMTETFRTPKFRFHQFPVTMPIDAIVTGLNEVQPIVLQGYPSMLRLLACEAEAGRLAIAPRLAIGIGEPLLAPTRAALQRAFAGISVQNWWATSETSGLAMSCGAGPWLHLSDDTLIVELVDQAGEPIAPGQTAAKIYVTNLFNKAMPLIRYELSDQPTLLAGPCPCGSAHRRVADLAGRHDELFVYSGAAGRSIVVHPKVFTSVLFSEPGVLDYQAVQTERGANISFLQGAPVDCEAVADAISLRLASLGVAQPKVVLSACAALQRTPGGKLVRHVRLSANPN